jgi:hypothetical protein
LGEVEDEFDTELNQGTPPDVPWITDIVVR